MKGQCRRSNFLYIFGLRRPTTLGEQGVFLTVAWKRMSRGKRTKAALFLTSKFEGATRRESPEYLGVGEYKKY